MKIFYFTYKSFKVNKTLLQFQNFILIQNLPLYNWKEIREWWKRSVFGKADVNWNRNSVKTSILSGFRVCRAIHWKFWNIVFVWIFPEIFNLIFFSFVFFSHTANLTYFRLSCYIKLWFLEQGNVKQRRRQDFGSGRNILGGRPGRGSPENFRNFAKNFLRKLQEKHNFSYFFQKS